MKKLSLLMIPAILVGAMSCKKDIYGCKDPEAENYSSKATVDDGSCFKIDNIESDIITIQSSDWFWSDPYWGVHISYAAITQDVVDNGAVLVYMEVTANNYTQLPITIYPETSYSTSVEATHTVGMLKIYFADSDHLTLSPGQRKFKIVVIQNKNKVTNEEIKQELLKKK
jgi:hypothetical protein